MTEDIDDIEAPVEKTFVRSVRLKPSEWEEVKARAERAGMLPNSYVVWAITRAPERSDIRDTAAPLALSDGESAAVVGSADDVQDAARAVVEDDGDWVVLAAGHAADHLVEDTAAGGDVAEYEAKLQAECAILRDLPWKEGKLGEGSRLTVRGATWPTCGHPKTPENTQKRGKGRPGACRICRRALDRASYARTQAKAKAT
jgi:hypothetical protein